LTNWIARRAVDDERRRLRLEGHGRGEHDHERETDSDKVRFPHLGIIEPSSVISDLEEIVNLFDEPLG